jgi:hypothetical protein
MTREELDTYRDPLTHLLNSVTSSGELKLFANIFADEIGY